MDFARKQLEKYGWCDGKGLGKNENGISEALKPKLKRGVNGVGHDLASDFTEHWWTQLYDKAASNVQVEEKNGRTKKIKTKDDDFKITNSTWRIKQRHEQFNSQDEYTEYFVKTAVLTNGGSVTEKVRDSESEDENVFKMTDEELFAACEGRTAHKGARHGLRASGKLARIERQEQMLLSQPKYCSYSHAKTINKEKPSINDLQVVEDLNLNSDADCVQIRKKKKKRKQCVSNEEKLENAEEIAKPLPEKREIKKSSDSDTSMDLFNRSMDTSKQNEENIVRKSKKSKRKNNKIKIPDEEFNEINSEEIAKPLPEKMEIKRSSDSDTSMDLFNRSMDTSKQNEGNIVRKSKKSKRKNMNIKIPDEELNYISSNPKIEKKHKITDNETDKDCTQSIREDLSKKIKNMNKKKLKDIET